MSTPAISAQTPPRPARARQFGLGLLVLLLIALAFAWSTLAAYARTGTAYGARVGCSCRFVGGRSLADCAHDFEPGMGVVTLSEDASAHSVTAAALWLFARTTATYRAGEGCRLEPWRG